MVLASSIEPRPEEAEHLVPGVNAAFLRSRAVAPIALEGDTLLCSAANPEDEMLRAALAFASGRPVRMVANAASETDAALEPPPQDTAALAADGAQRSDSLAEVVFARLRSRRTAGVDWGSSTHLASPKFQVGLWQRHSRLALLECVVCALCIVGVITTQTIVGSLFAAALLAVMILAPSGPVRRPLTLLQTAGSTLLGNFGPSDVPPLGDDQRSSLHSLPRSAGEYALFQRLNNPEQLAQAALAGLDEMARMLRIVLILTLSLLAVASF